MAPNPAFQAVVEGNFAKDAKIVVGCKSGGRSLQAAALLEAAEESRLPAYLVLCLLTGVRSEEARALTWDHVDLDTRAIAVWRSVRAHGDIKTNRSRRTLRQGGGAVAGARPGVHHDRGYAV